MKIPRCVSGESVCYPAAEEAAQAHFDRKLAEEEKWIRQGIKARRTRNEGRVRALKDMRQERKKRRQKVGAAKIQLSVISILRETLYSDSLITLTMI